MPLRHFWIEPPEEIALSSLEIILTAMEPPSWVFIRPSSDQR